MAQDQITALQADVKKLTVEVAKGEVSHDNLKELLEKHVVDTKEWRDNTSAQVNAIANALLQEQTRDAVEDEQESADRLVKQQSRMSESDKRLMWRTTIVIAIVTFLTNADKAIGFVVKVLGGLSGSG